MGSKIDHVGSKWGLRPIESHFEEHKWKKQKRDAEKRPTKKREQRGGNAEATGTCALGRLRKTKV